MKRLFLAAALVAATVPALAADVGVSISIGQPGFYGRLDIGGYPQPQVIYAEPRVVRPVAFGRQPIYLRVPPGHARNWRKHCGEYRACGERVYFVRDSWYDREYVPRYEQRHGGWKHREDPRGNGRGNDHNYRGYERGGDRRDYRDDGRNHRS